MNGPGPSSARATAQPPVFAERSTRQPCLPASWVRVPGFGFCFGAARAPEANTSATARRAAVTASARDLAGLIAPTYAARRTPIPDRQPNVRRKQRGCVHAPTTPHRPTQRTPGLRLGHLLRLQDDGNPPPPQSRHRPLLGHQPDRSPLPLRRNPPRNRLPLQAAASGGRAVRPRGQDARRAALISLALAPAARLESSRPGSDPPARPPTLRQSGRTPSSGNAAGG